MARRGSGKPLAERIKARSLLDERTGCWLWQGSKDKDGYGWISIPQPGKLPRKYTAQAHRIAYTEFVGVIPEGMLVCHGCDIPSCVNPDHLFLGTFLDNAQDCIKKGRKSHASVNMGEKSGQSKLTENQVLFIRNSKQPRLLLAKKFGVSVPHVRGIQCGFKWKHLPLTLQGE